METTMNFKEAVLDRSQEKPVLVDFWAPWCGPCRVLGPVIEQIAAEQQDRWELVKINTEEEQEIAQEYRIMSIPNVKLFHRGEVIAEFSGALPRASLLRWLEENLPDDRKNDLEQILYQLENSDTIDPRPLETFVQEHPDMMEAKLNLARLLVLSEPERSRELVEEIKLGHPLFDAAEDVRLLAELHGLKANGAVAEKLIEARTALLQDENSTAIEKIIEAVEMDKTFQNDLPRRLAIALFRSWGPQHPLTKSYRWKFDMALY
ncbi:thioredoxin [Flavilitoribacter nigricans]|uniref:Thioredoxin n=1 Tax=Flavilitoribacter nigricans (strain ATCC 23147 / DSM 23189 / NBRC 102662 / NCIMB 1420 / SS-2) TaxID=1122177 RepID=A0A2D0MZU4_FLAN2|nr:thioredoxin [Flavilitoribacter nigricans]PHN01765.1 thioredoxin [Flavilitoribacter nigricans DSM 23189 = NBRC 102662]